MGPMWEDEVRYRKVEYTRPRGFVRTYGWKKWTENKRPDEDMADVLRNLILGWGFSEKDGYLQVKRDLMQRFLKEAYH